MSPADAIPKAKTAALKALELDSELAEVHALMALIMATTDWDWPGSEKEFRRAIELNPGSARAHLYYGHILSAQGSWEDSLKELRRARKLDPAAFFVNLDLGWTLYLSGQADQAIEQLQRTIELDANLGWGHSHLGWVYAQQGRYVDALAELERSKSLEETSYVRSLIGYVYAISGKRVEAERVLKELLKESQRSYANAFHIAALHDSLGNKDRAFEWLDRAYKERLDTLIWLKVDPRFASLRSDPRYANLLHRIGL